MLRVMNWTIMPANLIARAWSDNRFRLDLLRNPSRMFKENGISVPDDVKLCVVENNEDISFIVLPHRGQETFKLSYNQLVELLEEETGGDRSLEFWLPPEVMAEAFTNPMLKRRLLINANEVLSEFGYEPAHHTYVVVENEESLFHLALPMNKWKVLDFSFDELEAMLTEEFSSEISFH